MATPVPLRNAHIRMTRADVEIADEQMEDKIIRRQRLRREQLQKVPDSLVSRRAVHVLSS